jgi:hypothetical protein
VKEKIKKIKTHIDQAPKFQKAVASIKPKKTVWGILGIIVFFFLPELMTYLWQDELINWSHAHSVTEPLALQRMLYSQLEGMFIAGVSFINLVIGSLLLLWVLKSK